MTVAYEVAAWGSCPVFPPKPAPPPLSFLERHPCNVVTIHGQDVPRTTIFPPVVVSDDARDAWIAAVGDDEIASWQWTQELVDAQLKANIDGMIEGAALPPVPVRN